MEFNTLSVIGLGYIGLPTAAVIASRRKKVVGVDINPKAVATINQGDIHIVEPALDILVHSTVNEGYLRATLVPEPADAFLVAVPTPFQSASGCDPQPDLSCIKAASQAIAPVLQKGNLVILESTAPVGTTEQMARWLAEARPDLSFPQTHGEASDIRIAHCPERVLPGQVLRELVENDRVVGGMTPRCSKQACALYKLFVEGECVVTTARTAEMAKLTENSFRDVNIAFANELSIICDQLDINVWELIALANRHPRVNILQPGPGVGGHCIAVDPWFIVSQTPEQARLIRMARQVNEGKPSWVLAQVQQALGAFLTAHPDRTAKEVTLACFGLAFKPDIDDLRESPAVQIAAALVQDHAGSVQLVEPHINQLPEGLQASELVTADQAIDSADILVMLVDHQAFYAIDPDRLCQHSIVDCRGVWV